MKKKIAICVGTRPEAIKMSPLIVEFLKNKSFLVSVCVTGQHKEMVNQVFNIFGISADVNFNLLEKSNNLSSLTSNLITDFGLYFDEFTPDLVLAQGDTATVFAAAYSSYIKKIPFGHVEAGLRTGNLYSPWPEEGYRSMISSIATLHFAPTYENKDNLLSEGIPENKIFVTGNTVIDALLFVSKEVNQMKKHTLNLPPEIVNLLGKRIVLITGHRRENQGKGLLNLCNAILTLSKVYKDVHFVFPVHLNSSVQKQVNDVLGIKSRDNIWLIEPVPYKEFVWLMKNSFIIITDSGGIQEEAPSLDKPVLVTRDTTERPEGILVGTVKLIGTKKEDIIDECSKLLDDKIKYTKHTKTPNPYGDGKASEYIVEICSNKL